MKKIIIVQIIFTVLISINVKAQMAVTAPVLEQQSIVQNKTMTTMSTTIASMEASERKINKIMQSAKWVKDLSSVKKLMTIMETLACNSKNLDVYMSIYGGNCLISMNYNFQILKINSALDNVSVLLTNGLYMTPGERMDLLDKAIEKFTEAQNEIGNLNRFFERLMEQEEENKKSREEYTNAFNMDRKYH